MIDFYRRTGLDPIDPIAFRSWLETETEIYHALGGAETVLIFIETIMRLDDWASPDSLVAILQYRAKKRQQLDFAQELQSILANKKAKTDEDQERINYLADQIRKLEEDIGYDPLASVLTATDIAEKADNLWELPDFLPTQFKSLNMAMRPSAVSANNIIHTPIFIIIGNFPTIIQFTFSKNKYPINQERKKLCV